MALEAAAPFGRPEFHRMVQTCRDVSLRIWILGEHRPEIVQKSIQYFGMTADGEAISRRVANPAVRMSPVMDHAEIRLGLPVKKNVHAAGDHYVQIQKQGGAGQSRQLVRPER